MITFLIWLQFYIFGTFVALALGNATARVALARTCVNDKSVDNESARLLYVVILTLSSWLGVGLFIIGLFLGLVGYFIHRGQKDEVDKR